MSPEFAFGLFGLLPVLAWIGYTVYWVYFSPEAHVYRLGYRDYRLDIDLRDSDYWRSRQLRKSYDRGWRQARQDQELHEEKIRLEIDKAWLKTLRDS